MHGTKLCRDPFLHTRWFHHATCLLSLHSTVKLWFVIIIFCCGIILVCLHTCCETTTCLSCFWTQGNFTCFCVVFFFNGFSQTLYYIVSTCILWTCVNSFTIKNYFCEASCSCIQHMYNLRDMAAVHASRYSCLCLHCRKFNILPGADIVFIPSQNIAWHGHGWLHVH